MHRPTPPLPKGGGFASGKTGGIPQACRFPHRFVLLGKCLLWNPSVTASPCQLPLAREPFCARYRYCGGSGSTGQSPPGHCGGGFASGKTGGIPQACRFPHRFVLLGKCLLWNPSVTASPCQLPLAREPCGQCPQPMRTVIFSESLLPLQCPVSLVRW